jgi:hypothetical protein
MIAAGLALLIVGATLTLVLAIDALARADRRRKREATRWLRAAQTDHARRVLRMPSVGVEKGDGLQASSVANHPHLTAAGEPTTQSGRSTVVGSPAALTQEVPK